MGEPDYNYTETFSFRINEYNHSKLYNNRKHDNIIKTSNTKYLFYFPVLRKYDISINPSVDYWDIPECTRSNGEKIYDLNEVYEQLVEFDNTKKLLFKEYYSEILLKSKKLYSEDMIATSINLNGLIGSDVLLNIEAILAFKQYIFRFFGSPNTFLEHYFKRFTVIIDEETSLYNKYQYNDTWNHFIDRFINLQRFYEVMSFDPFQSTSDMDREEKSKYKEECKIYNQVKPFLEMIKSKSKVFFDFVRIMKSRYLLNDEEAKDISWTLFIKCLLKIYHDKWLEYCVCGEIGERSLEDYVKQCCDDDMLSVENREAVTTFIYYYCYLQNNPIEYPNIQIADKIICHIEKYTKDNNLKAMEYLLFSNQAVSANQLFYTIDDIDLMDGVEFEKLIAKLFRKMGYDAEVTKTSGDQGIDVLATKNGFKYGIQAKCYSSQVGNSAIQEAVAGKAYYSLNKVIVVTNNFFTKSAIKLAEANNVILWDRNILKEKLMYLNG